MYCQIFNQTHCIMNNTSFIPTITRFCVFCLFVLGFMSVSAQNCSQPSNLNSMVLPGGSVSLSWAPPGGAVSFVVQYRVGNSGPWLAGGTVNTPNQVISGLAPETVYTWRVRANCSTFSSVATFNSGGNTGGNTACSSPSNLDAFVTSETTADLSWAPIEGAFFYTVQYRLNNLGGWTNAGSVAGTSISVVNLLPNSEYGWRVKASCSVYSSVALFNTGIQGGGGNTSCSQPSNLDALPLSTTSVNLVWSQIQEAQNYTVEYRPGLSGAWLSGGTVTATNLVLSGLLPATQYSWRVKASCSDFSSQAVFTTGSSGGSGGGGSTSCSAPSNTNTLAVTATTAVVEWEANPGALNYTVQYRRWNVSTYTTVGTFTAATATIAGLLPNTEYVWRVKANCSPYGSDVQFSTPAQSGSFVAPRNVEESPSVALFPNPVSAGSGMVQIAGFQPGAQLELFSLTGQRVRNQALSADNAQINVSDLKSGTYFVRIFHQDGTAHTLRLMVAK